MSNSIPIIILGMHRSGTSCLAGSLEQAGLCLGDNVCQQLETNKKGTRENFDICRLNESILNFNDASWRIPPKDISWTDQHIQEAKKIIRSIQSSCEVSPWGFKDPRTIITFPFWQSILSQYYLVGAIRNPLSVAKSLNARDSSFSIEEGMELWYFYNTKILSMLEKNPFPVISFDSNQNDYNKKLAKLCNQMSLNSSPENEYYDGNLKSKPIVSEMKIPKHVDRCYAMLKEYII